MRKVIHQKQSQIFEKVVLRNGKPFLVRFVVVEREGKLRGKVISCEAVETLAGESADTKQYLPFDIGPATHAEETRTFDAIVSPYTSLEFFISQMTRAPSF